MCKKRPCINTFDSVEELSAALGEYVKSAAQKAIETRRRFTVALSGGSLVKILGRALAGKIDGRLWHIFWADERCVSLTSDQSNYALARQHLFSHTNIPAKQIYPINDALDPTAAAADYQKSLARVFGSLPRFDLILLGIGGDGHTASLFPNHTAVDETEKWVVAVLDSPKPPPQRITLTLLVINNARSVVFAATGKEKAAIIAQVLNPQAAERPLPAQLVKPTDGTLEWFISTDS